MNRSDVLIIQFPDSDNIDVARNVDSLATQPPDASVIPRKFDWIQSPSKL